MNRLRTITSALILAALLTSPLYGYVTQKGLSSTNSIVQVKWGSGAVTWQMNPTASPNLGGSREFGDVIRQSFRSWASVPTALIKFTEGSPVGDKFAYDGKNVVVTNMTSNDWTALGLSSSVLAFTAVSWSGKGAGVDRTGQPVSFEGQIMDADIVFNPYYEFSTDDIVPPAKIDFQGVLTHEIGHFLGLDHSPNVSSMMFWTTLRGVSSQRALTTDDMAGISVIYPSDSFASKSTLKGTVRTTANVPVYGAIVVALNSSGQPAASTITDPNGQYSIMGLDPGLYTVYAQALEGFTSSGNFNTLSDIYPGMKINLGFTLRFR